jgi:hypothetical protein
MVGYHGFGAGKFDWLDVMAYWLTGLTHYLFQRHLIVSKQFFKNESTLKKLT